MIQSLLLCLVFSLPGAWDSWSFLIGEWVGEGAGGSGGFSFQFDLQGKVLVRKNRAEYPATKDRGASVHEDLMVVYQEGGRTRAIYFDTEDHTINYTAAFPADQNSLIFLSDVSPSAPRYRLTYTKTTGETLAIRFEIAQIGRAHV